jgi:hypothetical protein
MNRSLTNSVKRREFLKSTGLIAGAAFTGLNFPYRALANSGLASNRFTQVINEARLYMTYYAFFEEPDEDIPPALYFDALTGRPTDALTLIPPIGQRSFSRLENDQGGMITSAADFYKPNLPCKSGRRSGFRQEG